MRIALESKIQQQTAEGEARYKQLNESSAEARRTVKHARGQLQRIAEAIPDLSPDTPSL